MMRDAKGCFSRGELEGTERRDRKVDPSPFLKHTIKMEKKNK